MSKSKNTSSTGLSIHIKSKKITEEDRIAAQMEDAFPSKDLQPSLLQATKRHFH